MREALSRYFAWKRKIGQFILGLQIVCLCQCFAVAQSSDDFSQYRNGWGGFDIPNDGITLVWEHSCIQHIQKGETQRAREVKETIDWQRANKKFVSIGEEDFSEFIKRYQQAKKVKTEMGDKWACNPPPEKFRIAYLKIGADLSDSASVIPSTFLSNTKEGVAIEGVAQVVDACEACRIDWSVTFPKHETRDAHFENQMQIKYTHAIAQAPKADRGQNFRAVIDAILYSKGLKIDEIKHDISQNELDQLRQEYVDMEKKKIPMRNEFVDSYGLSHTKHFKLVDFNSTEMAGGGEYRYILDHVLEKLEQVRHQAGSISMKINSGFRNPYKHYNILHAQTSESSHIYGLAADIRLADFNQDGRINDQDRFLITRPAKTLGACVEPKGKTRTWIHLDWRGLCPLGW